MAAKKLNFVVRAAKEEDLTSIYQLILALAAYEKAPQEVTNTLEQFQKDFHQKHFHCLVAETLPQQQIIGMLLYCFSYSTWKGLTLYIDDFIVDEAYRRQGVGKALFDKVLQIAQQSDVKRIMWQVLDWNTPAIRFYERYPVKKDERWINFYIHL